MSQRPLLTATFAAATLAALAGTPAPAHAQLGGLMKRAKQAVVEKTADKAVDKAVEKATGDSAAAHAPASAPGSAPQGAPARSGQRATRGGGSALSGPINDALVQKILAYDAAYTEAYHQALATDPRFKQYQSEKTAYERCYNTNLTYEKATRRYTRLAEQARLDDKLDAYSKWQDSLSKTRLAQLKAVPGGRCEIPRMDGGLARAASESAAKSAEEKTGTKAPYLGGLTEERITGALRLSTAERQKAISSGAYSAAEMSAIDKNRAPLQAWLSHSYDEPIMVNEAELAKYNADMDRYHDAKETYDRCSYAAQQAGGTPEVPASMQAQMMNTKPPTEAQQKEMERLSKLGEAAHDRGDDAKAMIYADSIQKIMGIKMSPQAAKDGQKYGQEVMAAQEKSKAAQKKCGLPPDEPIKPAYVD